MFELSPWLGPLHYAVSTMIDPLVEFFSALNQLFQRAFFLTKCLEQTTKYAAGMMMLSFHKTISCSPEQKASPFCGPLKIMHIFLRKHFK